MNTPHERSEFEDRPRQKCSKYVLPQLILKNKWTKINQTCYDLYDHKFTSYYF